MRKKVKNCADSPSRGEFGKGSKKFQDDDDEKSSQPHFSGISIANTFAKI